MEVAFAICAAEFRGDSDIMSQKHLMMLAIAIAMTSEPAIGELRGVSATAPTFSLAETEVIKRNVALSSLVSDDPWVVRRMLDALAGIDEHHDVAPLARQMDLPPEQAPESFDPDKNPDVERLQRASPEAVHDLFQLLKQASGGKLSSPKH